MLISDTFVKFPIMPSLVQEMQEMQEKSLLYATLDFTSSKLLFYFKHTFAHGQSKSVFSLHHDLAFMDDIESLGGVCYGAALQVVVTMVCLVVTRCLGDAVGGG